LGARLFELLDTAAHDGRESTTTLYELDDEQLESALEKFGENAHIVLGVGTQQVPRYLRREQQTALDMDRKPE
jgi:hypothetical protein